jgi:predicted RNA-binding protein with PUA-like domain
MMEPPDESPRCYFAVFADPNLPGHVSVEGGRFGNIRMPSTMRPGDMVLLYCTGTYSAHEKSVPGIGVLTSVDHVVHDFRYDYMPLERAVPLDFLRFAFVDDDKERLANIRREYLFQITRESFRAVMQASKLAARQPYGAV